MRGSRTDRSTRELDAATRALIAAPASSLADIAAAIGVSRTTLHRRYPTRTDLLEAIAHHAINQLHAAQHAAGFGNPAPDAPPASFETLTISLIALAPQLQLLLGSPEVGEAAVSEAVTELDAPVLQAIRQGQAEGRFHPQMPPEWILESLYALSIAAGIRVQNGTLARNDAAPLVHRTWASGCHT